METNDTAGISGADAPPRPPLRIFINYRHEDMPFAASALYRELKGRFGAENIFFDAGALRPGMEFLEEITSRLSGTAGAFLALIGPEWLPTMEAHTEVTREHLLVNSDTWTQSGLLDFETAMTGDRAYEFAAADLFLPRGDPRLLGRILAAYGRSFDPRELLAYTLLHVHSNLPECLTEFPAPPEPTLDSLAQTWFGTA